MASTGGSGEGASERASLSAHDGASEDPPPVLETRPSCLTLRRRDESDLGSEGRTKGRRREGRGMEGNFRSKKSWKKEAL